MVVSKVYRHRFETWEQARNHGWAVSLDYMMRVHEGAWPEDAFTVGQMASKLWLVENLSPYLRTTDRVAILACWFGQLAPLLVNECDTIVGFDSDPEAVALSEEFCEPEIRTGWKFKASVADVNYIEWSEPEFVLDGELITDWQPDVIINTSTEHMTNEWYESVSPGTLVAVQGNSDPTLDGHINARPDYEDWASQFEMERVCVEGELRFPGYTRYMKIGEK